MDLFHFNLPDPDPIHKTDLYTDSCSKNSAKIMEKLLKIYIFKNRIQEPSQDGSDPKHCLDAFGRIEEGCLRLRRDHKPPSIMKSSDVDPDWLYPDPQNLMDTDPGQ